MKTRTPIDDLYALAREWATGDGHRVGSTEWWEANRAYRLLILEDHGYLIPDSEQVD